MSISITHLMKIRLKYSYPDVSTSVPLITEIPFHGSDSNHSYAEL